MAGPSDPASSHDHHLVAVPDWILPAVMIIIWLQCLTGQSIKLVMIKGGSTLLMVEVMGCRFLNLLM
jgi:hypothetical protein